MERQVTTIRLSAEERRKLAELARRSQRTKSDVLRLLLAQAEIAPMPGVRLTECTELRDGAKDREEETT